MSLGYPTFCATRSCVSICYNRISSVSNPVFCHGYPTGACVSGKTICKDAAGVRSLRNNVASAFSWPLGMPIVRKLEKELWEVRSHLPNRIARVIFTVSDDIMILLHGFIKKSQKTPTSDLTLARKRLQTLWE